MVRSYFSPKYMALVAQVISVFSWLRAFTSFGYYKSRLEASIIWVEGLLLVVKVDFLCTIYQIK